MTELKQLEDSLSSFDRKECARVLGELERLKALAWSRIMTSEDPAREPVQGEERLLTMKQVAERLNIPLSRAYELVRKGELEGVRVGKKYVRVSTGTLLAYQAQLVRT